MMLSPGDLVICRDSVNLYGGRECADAIPASINTCELVNTMFMVLCTSSVMSYKFPLISDVRCYLATTDMLGFGWTYGYLLEQVL